MTKGKVRGRRTNNEGTITKRADGRWEARITLADGKRKSFYGKTQAEVRVKLEQAKVDKQHGILPVNEQMTVAQYLPMWLEIRRQRIDESSYMRYCSAVKTLLDLFGKTRLVKVSASQVQTRYAEMLRLGKTASRVHYCHIVFKSALADAVEMEHLVKNPLAKVSGPRVHVKEKMTLSEEQVHQLLTSLEGKKHYALMVMALSTGMRIGELAALQWQDVDFKQHTVRVRQGLQDSLQGLILHEPKTPSSIRTIHLTNKTVDILRQHQVQQQGHKELMGKRWHGEHMFVFAHTDGRHFPMHSFQVCTFSHIMQEAQLLGPPAFTFHDLRHTFATLMLANGAPVKVVSEMLGHVDISITLRTYGHVIPRMQQQAIGIMEQILEKKRDN